MKIKSKEMVMSLHLQEFGDGIRTLQSIYYTGLQEK